MSKLFRGLKDYFYVQKEEKHFKMTNLGVGCDFFGNDLTNSNAFATNFSLCEKQCVNTFGCTHFTWNFHTNNCWLKEGRVRPNDVVYSNEAVCGIRKDLWLLNKIKWNEMSTRFG